MPWSEWKNEKRKVINIGYNQGQILHYFTESEGFIDTLVKRLIMSKITITFKISLYKLLKEYPLIKHSNLSMHYFEKVFLQICQISWHQLNNIVVN